MTVDQAIQQAAALHQAGQLAQAETLFRQVLAAQPDHPDALHRLGLIAYQTGHHDAALPLLFRACQLRPDVAEYFANLGVALSACRRMPEAIAAFERAIALRPDQIDAIINLGNALVQGGKSLEAVNFYRRALAIAPTNFRAFHGLGFALSETGDMNGAIAAYTEATRMRPDAAESFSNLGDALNEVGRLDEAIEACKKAIALRPNIAQPYNNLGRAHLKAQQMPQAVAAFRRAIELDPNLFEAYNNLGSLLKDTGELDEAIACYDHALALRPDFAPLDSNRLYTLTFSPKWDATAMLQQQRLWNQRHAEPLKGRISPHQNDRSPDRRLRIGYVSPDFRDHVVGRNILPLLREHDRGQFEIFCYSNHINEDRMTPRIKAYADHWRQIAGASPDRVAALIREDQIDILVDLALHMAHNRLLVFARKPAPIQVTFGGYPGGTGMEAIDYRLTDPWLDPPESDWQYVEKSVRLPESFWCYDTEGMSLADAPTINALPALGNGHVTFGCLNNLCKINDEVLALWRRVLDAVPGSRLRVLTPAGDHLQRLSEKMNGRVDFVHWLPRLQYLAGYHQIDLGLDTFPYNGHTTSLDSLWMGVPVVTLIGNTVMGRAGWSQLSNLKLPELAARTPDEFVSIATTLAGDLPRLRQFRSTLRDRMKTSPLMDAPKFARNIESAYRQMWRTWTNQK